MTRTRLLLQIATVLFILCFAVGAVSAANTVSNTWVTSPGTTYAGNNASISSLVIDVTTTNVHNSTGADVVCFAVDGDVSVAPTSGTEYTFTLPIEQLAGSNVSQKTSGTGTQITVPQYTIDFNDTTPTASVNFGEPSATHIYTSGTYTPAVTLVSAWNATSAPLVTTKVPVSPATIEVYVTAVSFDNGTGIEFVENFLYNGVVDPVSTSVKAGSRFQGWNLSVDGTWYTLFNATGDPQAVSGYIDADGKWVNSTADALTVYANWTGNVTKVNFYSQGSIYDARLNTFGEATNATTDPTWDDHVFLGWNHTMTGAPFNSPAYNNSGVWNYAGTNGEVLNFEAVWADAPNPPVNLPTVSINISTGEMTTAGDSYTGFIYVNAPAEGFNNNWSLGAFKFRFDTAGTVAVSELLGGSYLDSNWSVFNNTVTKEIDGSTSSISWLTGTEPISIVNFTITPSGNSAASISLPYVEVWMNNSNGYDYRLTEGAGYSLRSDAPNSVICDSSSLTMKTEDKAGSVSLGTNFTVLNEFAQPITSNYNLSYAFQSGNIVRVVDDGEPYFIALNGTGTNQVTATLNTSGNEQTLDVLEVPVNLAKKADLTSDAVSFSGPYVFDCDGTGVAAKVKANLTLLKHNNATAEGITRSVGEQNGYVRNLTYTVTFYNETGGIVADPAVPGTYTFNLSVAGNGDYEEQVIEDDLIYSFVIRDNFLLTGEWTTNSADFSAVNKSTGYMTYHITSPLTKDDVMFSDSVVEKFNFTSGNQKEAYLPINWALTSTGTNLTGNFAYDQPNLVFYNNLRPVNDVDSVFYFVGYYLGDANMNGVINMQDSLFIAQRVSSQSFTDDQKLYAQIYSRGTNLDISDAQAIAKYNVHLVDAHYQDISS